MYKLKKLFTAILLGSILGIVCVIGARTRIFTSSFSGNLSLLLFALWYNRFIMGLVIGVSSDHFIFTQDRIYYWFNVCFRGMLLGTFISLAFYFTTAFLDTPTFIAGIAYGILIDMGSTLVDQKISDKREKETKKEKENKKISMN